jgi:hypothetical protein
MYMLTVHHEDIRAHGVYIHLHDMLDSEVIAVPSLVTNNQFSDQHADMLFLLLGLYTFHTSARIVLAGQLHDSNVSKLDLQ